MRPRAEVLIERFCGILHREPLRNAGQGFEVAFDEGLYEVAGLVLGVTVGHINHEGLDHQGPRPPVDDLRMDGDDRRIVLQSKVGRESIDLNPPMDEPIRY